MSGLAEVLLNSHYHISGSDLRETSQITKLKRLGAIIHKGHHASYVKDADMIVYTSAIDPDNDELQYARANDLKVLKRAELLASLMNIKKGVAVVGTHGKTTTTSLLTTILEDCQLSPTYFIGGFVKHLQRSCQRGSGDLFIAEVDESDGSFLLFNPVLAVITNIDNDHLDFYKDEEHLMDAFKEFAENIPKEGTIAFNIHDKRSMKVRNSLKRSSVTFGIRTRGKEGADLEAGEIVYNGFTTSFNLYLHGEFQGRIVLNLHGNYNILNALGAILLAHHLKISFDQMAKALVKFQGVLRRFENLYHKNNFEIIDDYAHHPTAIKKTLQLLRSIRPGKEIIVIFQPHRFTRMQRCWDDFVHAFQDADHLYLTPIYAADEKSILGLEAKLLVKEINEIYPKFCKEMRTVKDVEQIVDRYKDQKISLITLGAGDIELEIRRVVASMG